MPDVLVKLNGILARRAKQKLALATLGSLLVSILDTVAIALVYPLVNLATQGGGDRSGAVRFVADLLGNPSDRSLLILLTLCVVSLFILKDLGSMAFEWWMIGFVLGERVRTSARILRLFLTAPYTEVSRRSSAELLRAMDYSVMQVFNYTVNGLMYTVTNSIAILAVAVALLLVSPLPTLVAIAYFGVAAVVYLRLVKPRATAAGLEMTEASLAGWRTAFAALGAIKELNLRGTQEHFVRRYEDAQLRGAFAGRYSSFLAGLPRYMLEILFIIAVGLVLLIGVLTSAGGSANSLVGLLAIFVAAGFRMLPSVTGLLGSVSNIKVGAPSLDIVHREVLAASALVPQADDLEPALPLRKVLSVKKVGFTYPGGSRPVLRSVTVDVPHGSSVALVGGSGAGKTTLVDLILGLHTPDSGRILVDGVDIADCKARWQRNIGYVAQDVYVLDGTLAENIAFDQDPDEIDHARLSEVIDHAQLADLVAELPDGINTYVGEKGARLSGGQRQRIGIARALYRQPQLLVFDEATSSLDNETEHRIGRTVAGLHGVVTVVLVAHRLSTVRRSDQIVFIKDGRVEINGSFDEVRAGNREFAHLVQLGSLDPAASAG